MKLKSEIVKRKEGQTRKKKEEAKEKEESKTIKGL